MADMILERSKIDGTINDLGLIDDDIYALITSGCVLTENIPLHVIYILENEYLRSLS